MYQGTIQVVSASIKNERVSIKDQTGKWFSAFENQVQSILPIQQGETLQISWEDNTTPDGRVFHNIRSADRVFAPGGQPATLADNPQGQSIAMNTQQRVEVPPPQQEYAPTVQSIQDDPMPEYEDKVQYAATQVTVAMDGVLERVVAKGLTPEQVAPYLEAWSKVMCTLIIEGRK